MQQFKYVQTKSCTRKGLKCQFVRINYKKFKVNRKEKEMDDGDYRRALIQKATLHFSSHLRNHPQWCSGKVAKSRLTELRPISFLSFFFRCFFGFVCVFVCFNIYFLFPIGFFHFLPTSGLQSLLHEAMRFTYFQFSHCNGMSFQSSYIRLMNCQDHRRLTNF